MEKQVSHSVSISPVTTMDDLNKALDDIIKYIDKWSVSLNKNEKFIKNMFILCRDFPIQLKHSNKIEIRTSHIHGKGVFARDFIGKDTVITFCPAHAICIDDDLRASDQTFCDRIIRDKLDLFYGSSYCSDGSKWVTVIGDPEKTDDKNLCGHMINDPIGNVFKDIEYMDIQDPILFKNTTSKYYIDGVKKRNCIINYHSIHPCVYIVTTRDIQKDEELLIVYGATYWHHFNYDENDLDYDEYANLLKKICDPEYVKWFLSICPEYKDYMGLRITK